MLGPSSMAWSEKVWRWTPSTCRMSGHRPAQKSRRGSTSICSGVGPWRHEHAVTESSVGSESVRRRRHERATPTVRGEGGEERKNTRRQSVKR